MATTELHETAKALVGDGKGILAADETTACGPTLMPAPDTRRSVRRRTGLSGASVHGGVCTGNGARSRRRLILRIVNLSASVREAPGRGENFRM
jgi:hypothetical protein